jgi:hypothetical protein
LRHLKAFQLPVAAMHWNQFFRLIHRAATIRLRLLLCVLFITSDGGFSIVLQMADASLLGPDDQCTGGDTLTK